MCINFSRPLMARVQAHAHVQVGLVCLLSAAVHLYFWVSYGSFATSLFLFRSDSSSSSNSSNSRGDTFRRTSTSNTSHGRRVAYHFPSVSVLCLVQLFALHISEGNKTINSQKKIKHNGVYTSPILITGFRSLGSNM